MVTHKRDRPDHERLLCRRLPLMGLLRDLESPGVVPPGLHASLHVPSVPVYSDVTSLSKLPPSRH